MDFVYVSIQYCEYNYYKYMRTERVSEALKLFCRFRAGLSILKISRGLNQLLGGHRRGSFFRCMGGLSMPRG